MTGVSDSFLVRILLKFPRRLVVDRLKRLHRAENLGVMLRPDVAVDFGERKILHQGKIGDPRTVRAEELKRERLSKSVWFLGRSPKPASHKKRGLTPFRRKFRNQDPLSVGV